MTSDDIANIFYYFFQLGENHEKTKESSECLKHLTQQAVVLQKKMNEIYTGKNGAALPPIQIQPPSMGSVLDLLNIINGILFVQIRWDYLQVLLFICENNLYTNFGAQRGAKIYQFLAVFSQEDIDKVKAEIEKRQSEDLEESDLQQLKPPIEAV